MAKFRRNHQRGKYSVVGGSVKLGLAVMLLILLFVLTRPLISRFFDQTSEDKLIVDDTTAYYLPVGGDNPVYAQKHYYLAYDEDTEQAAWVAYELNLSHLNARKVSRTDYFSEDPTIRTGSAHYEDYRGSGYTRGHLVPAADRAFSREAMDETFLMSNISPQTYHFNGGIWRELEELTRDWARLNERLIVVSGPVFEKSNPSRIGRNGVAVPDAFFKVLIDIDEPDLKGIAFVIPNEKSDKPLTSYMVAIDQVETLTSLDFNANLLTSALEDSLESTVTSSAWPIDDVRFQLRVNEWNRR